MASERMRHTVAAFLLVATLLGCSASHPTTMKAIRVSKAEREFRAMLRESGVDLERPSIAEVWAVFKRFASVPVDCHESGVLFQCGVYEFTGEPRVHFGFVRQFRIHRRSEFSHFNQLDIGFIFPPTPSFEKSKLSVWSFDFKSLDEFFRHVESLPEFRKAAAEPEQLRLKIEQSDV